jgi:hypothetical protein
LKLKAVDIRRMEDRVETDSDELLDEPERDSYDYRVELLSDARGIYGVGENPARYGNPKTLIVRPDKLKASRPGQCALQQIPRPKFCRTVEGYFVDALHRAMCERHGQLRCDRTWISWSELADPKLARQTWHGLRRAALKVVNCLIRQALEVADPRALKAARKFPIVFRAELYNAFCRYGERAMQLSETFPLLATMLFTDFWSLSVGEDIRHRHIVLLLSGAKLKRISGSLEVPYLLRRVTPRATRYVRTTRISDVVLNLIPPSTPKQKAFLKAIGVAEELGPDFVLWTAKQVVNMTAREEMPELYDIMDWARASGDAEIIRALDQLPEDIRRSILERCPNLVRRGGAELVTRHFSPDMSLKTVRRLSEEWHRAVANNMSQGQFVTFPHPWINVGEFDDHKIVPISDSGELYLAGRMLHNCAGTYTDRIVGGRSYLYTVMDRTNRPIVMVELDRTADGIQLGQIKARYNTPAPKEIGKGVHRWFNSHKRHAIPQEEDVRPLSEKINDCNGDSKNLENGSREESRPNPCKARRSRTNRRPKADPSEINVSNKESDEGWEEV